MLLGQKVIVVMPAYNAAATLERTWREIPREWVDEIILVDDASQDDTAARAQALGIDCVIRHERNRGYGANQKTCYSTALARGADIVVMLHADYQYDPRLLEALVYPIARGVFPVMLGSRILGKGALAGGMPLHKYVLNRLLTLVQNLLMGQKLAEYHTGYRAYSRAILQSLPLAANSDDFLFDNQVLAQIAWQGHTIGEVTCPARYFPEASSISGWAGVRYAWGVLGVSVLYRLCRWGLWRSPLFSQAQGK
jgi:glycosyltransferase involved in cell wall biosynthesis